MRTLHPYGSAYGCCEVGAPRTAAGRITKRLGCASQVRRPKVRRGTAEARCRGLEKRSTKMSIKNALAVLGGVALLLTVLNRQGRRR